MAAADSKQVWQDDPTRQNRIIQASVRMQFFKLVHFIGKETDLSFS